MWLNARIFRLVVGLALGVAVLRAPAARGDDVEDPDVSAARGHFKKGATAYEKEDFAGAIAEFEAGRVIKPAPAFDWNIGRCLDRLGRYPEAVAAYRRYLSSGPPADEDSTRRSRRRSISGRGARSPSR